MTWGTVASISWGDDLNDAGWFFASTFDAPRYVGCVGSAPWWRHPGNAVQATNLKASRVEAKASCFLGGCPELSGVATDIELSGFRAEIRDEHPPTVASVKGPLAANAVHKEKETVTFDVSDLGVGVLQAVAEVQIGGAGAWRELASAPVTTSTTCTPLRGDGYQYEFDSPQPCPLAVKDYTLTVDSSLLPPGAHQVRVIVEDAAGNRTDVIAARPYTVSPPVSAAAASSPPLAAINGREASRLVQLRLTAPAQKRLPSGGAFRVGGRLPQCPVEADRWRQTGTPYARFPAESRCRSRYLELDRRGHDRRERCLPRQGSAGGVSLPARHVQGASRRLASDRHRSDRRDCSSADHGPRKAYKGAKRQVRGHCRTRRGPDSEWRRARRPRGSRAATLDPSGDLKALGADPAIRDLYALVSVPSHLPSGDVPVPRRRRRGFRVSVRSRRQSLNLDPSSPMKRLVLAFLLLLVASPAAGAEPIEVTAQAKAAAADFLLRATPPGPAATICLVDTGVNGHRTPAA